MYTEESHANPAKYVTGPSTRREASLASANDDASNGGEWVKEERRDAEDQQGRVRLVCLGIVAHTWMRRVAEREGHARNRP